MPKRKRVDAANDSEKNSDEPRRPVIRQRSTDKVRLACPFYFRYPDNLNLAKSCTGPGYDNISRLKEHLYRCHAPARTISCPRCQTRFDDEESMNSHLKETRRCKIAERDKSNAVIEGISDDAMRLLRSRKGIKQHSSEDRWYDIWKKLFPDHYTPESPYMNSSSQRSEMDITRRFADFIIEGLPYLFKEAVKYDQLALTQRLHDTVHDNVSALVEQYLSKALGSKPRRQIFPQDRHTNHLNSPARTASTSELKFSTSESTISESSPIFPPVSITERTCNSPQLLDGQDILYGRLCGPPVEEAPLFLPVDWDINAPRLTPLIGLTGYLSELEGDFPYARTSAMMQYGDVSECGTITPMTTSPASPLDDVGGLQFKDSMY